VACGDQYISLTFLTVSIAISSTVLPGTPPGAAPLRI
jgi:hypothetical protein